MMNNEIYPGYSIYSTQHQITLKNLFLFEAISLYGRFFLSSPPKLNTNNQNYLHLGCGINKLEGWINADFFSGLKPWKNDHNKPDWMLDLRFPLNCMNNTWDGIFTEHTIEHLYPIQVLNLLKELNRTMKPGSWLRVSVPDLEKYIDYYCGKEVTLEFKNKWPTGCEAIRSLTQNYLHLSVWDSVLLKRFLEEVGFINVKKVNFGEGTDKVLLKDRKEREWETLYIECQKSEKA